MEATDSRECRNCHSAEHFILLKQTERAARAHQREPEEGRICISCHKGIAHRTPEEVAEEEAAKNKLYKLVFDLTDNVDSVQNLLLPNANFLP